MASKLWSQQASLSPDAVVQLIKIIDPNDATFLPLHFCLTGTFTPPNGSPRAAVFGTDSNGRPQSWAPLPGTISGFRFGARASDPVLELQAGAQRGQKISAAALLQLAANLSDDGSFVGLEVEITETYARFLDGGGDADGSVLFPSETYRISAVIGSDHKTLRFRLRSPLSMEGARLPARLAMRNACPRVFARRDAAGNFVTPYYRGKCPLGQPGFPVTATFDAKNRPTLDSSGNVVIAHDRDVCDQTETGCQLRFGRRNSPYGGAAGLGLRY